MNSGIAVYKQPVLSAVVVCKASKKKIKNSEKNRLITKARGIVIKILSRHLFLIRTIGSNIRAELTNLNKVRENGLRTFVRYSEEINEPAIITVARRISRWDCKIVVFKKLSVVDYIFNCVSLLY